MLKILTEAIRDNIKADNDNGLIVFEDSADKILKELEETGMLPPVSKIPGQDEWDNIWEEDSQVIQKTDRVLFLEYRLLATVNSALITSNHSERYNYIIRATELREELEGLGWKSEESKFEIPEM